MSGPSPVFGPLRDGTERGLTTYPPGTGKDSSGVGSQEDDSTSGFKVSSTTLHGFLDGHGRRRPGAGGSGEYHPSLPRSIRSHKDRRDLKTKQLIQRPPGVGDYQGPPSPVPTYCLRLFAPSSLPNVPNRLQLCPIQQFKLKV